MTTGSVPADISEHRTASGRARDAALGADPPEFEMILLRQLTSCLATPMFIVDPDGNLVYFNEPAEQILGRPFDTTDPMTLEQWADAFRPVTVDGGPLVADELPLVQAVRRGRPAQMDFRITGLDGAPHTLAVTAFPLIGLHDRHLGAVAIFWEQPAR
jgi:PAS domain-containing protein